MPSDVLSRQERLDALRIGHEFVQITKRKRRTVKRRADHKNLKRPSGGNVIPKYFASCDFVFAINFADCITHLAVGFFDIGGHSDHRINDLAIPRAATQNTAKRILNLFDIWRWVFTQQGNCRYHHAGRANAALGGTMILKTLGQIFGMVISLIKPADGFNRTASRLMCRHQTSANRIAVDQDGASTTITCVAPDFHITRTKFFAQNMGQPRTSFWMRRDRCSVQLERGCGFVHEIIHL